LLSCREQIVQVNGEKADGGCATSEVPQGSVLCPLVYIIYINYQDFKINSNNSKFVNDTTIGQLKRSSQFAFLRKTNGPGDLIDAFKCVKGFKKGDIGKVLTVNEQTRTRSNGFKLNKCRFNKDIGRNWFKNKVVDVWNRLSKPVSKRKYDR